MKFLFLATLSRALLAAVTALAFSTALVQAADPSTKDSYAKDTSNKDLSAKDHSDHSSAKDALTDEGNLITSITAKVDSVDTAKRQISLRGPRDNVITLSAGKDVKRFDEIKAGDYITADYYVSIALDLNMPDPDDMDNPITITDLSEKAPADAPPGAAEFNTIRVVATVEGMDGPTQTLALRGPAGRHFLVAVKDVEELKGLKLDDKVSVLCTQAVLISLDKATPGEEDKAKRSAMNASANKKRMSNSGKSTPSTAPESHVMDTVSP